MREITGFFIYNIYLLFMNSEQKNSQLISERNQPYKYGFVTPLESDRPQKGLSEETIKYISLS